MDAAARAGRIHGQGRVMQSGRPWGAVQGEVLPRGAGRSLGHHAGLGRFSEREVTWSGLAGSGLKVSVNVRDT